MGTPSSYSTILFTCCRENTDITRQRTQRAYSSLFLRCVSWGPLHSKVSKLLHVWIAETSGQEAVSFSMCFEKPTEIKLLRTRGAPRKKTGEFNISKVLQHMIDENHIKNILFSYPVTLVDPAIKRLFLSTITPKIARISISIIRLICHCSCARNNNITVILVTDKPAGL